MDVTPSNRKPSNLYSSTHHLAFESKKRSVSQFPATDNDLSRLGFLLSLTPLRYSLHISRKEEGERNQQQWHGHVSKCLGTVSVTFGDCWFFYCLFELEYAAKIRFCDRQTWAANCNTWFLIRLMPKEIVLSFCNREPDASARHCLHPVIVQLFSILKGLI